VPKIDNINIAPLLSSSARRRCTYCCMLAYKFSRNDSAKSQQGD